MTDKKNAKPKQVRAIEDEGLPPPIDKTAPEKGIGARIKEGRESLGLNFEQFAALTREYDDAGIAPVTLRRYEREGEGATLPGLRELRILCSALDLSADYLLLANKTPDHELRDREDWEALKALLRRVVDKGPFGALLPEPGQDPYANFARQEKLKRSRLHTKARGE